MGRQKTPPSRSLISLALLMSAGLATNATAFSEGVRYQTVRVTQGASLPVPTSEVFTKIVVSEPVVAVAAPVSNQEYYIRGRTIGSTNLLAYNEQGHLIQIVDIEVTPDIEAISRDIAALYPNTPVKLHPVADKIHVSGTVDSPEMVDRILEIVSGHAGDNVINAIETALPAQVLLEVRFVEASRDDIQEIGFGSEISQSGDFLFLTNSSPLSGPVGKSVGALFGGTGDTKIDFFLEALEERGVVRTLAEPNLVARSTKTASFLAGGEFPVPVAADEGNISIEFKNFGVSLEFTPTVVNQDQIILSVVPEVSGLDPRNSVRLSDVEIPALSVRRVDTQVELASGQSFAIAGLIQNDFQVSNAQTPLLGDIPILGALFRSSRFKNNETELVVIITPHLINSSSDGSQLATPMQDTENVSAWDLALNGKTENAPSAPFGTAVRKNVKLQTWSATPDDLY